ncbi:MAG: DUF6783 domain-containing protein, partial [Ruminococcus sp.]
TNCDAHLAESLFQTRSRIKLGEVVVLWVIRKQSHLFWR